MNDYWLRTDIDKLKAKVERLEEKIKELKKDKDMNNLEDRSIQEMFESLDSFNLSTMEKRYIKSFIDEKAEQNKYLYEKAASETFKRLKLEKEIKELKKKQWRITTGKRKITKHPLFQNNRGLEQEKYRANARNSKNDESVSRRAWRKTRTAKRNRNS